MTTKLMTPSRRAMIGALAALPVASVPAIAGVAAMDDPDPIFGLIEVWKRAKAKEEESDAIVNRLSDEVGHWNGVAVTCSRKDYLKIASIPDDELDMMEIGTKPWPKTSITYQARHRIDLEKWFDLWRFSACDEFETERAAALAEFDEARGAYDARREASGLNVAWQLNEKIADVRGDAEDVVMQAQPRTHAGAVALLVFAAEYWQRHEVEDYPDIPAAMVTAARAIAGDPSKIVISDKLAASLEGWLKPWQETHA
jgi:hypothetical protein